MNNSQIKVNQTTSPTNTMSNLLELGGRILGIITGYTPLSEKDDCPNFDDPKNESLNYESVNNIDETVNNEDNITGTKSKVKSNIINNKLKCTSIKLNVNKIQYNNKISRKTKNEKGKYIIQVIEVKSNLWNCENQKSISSKKVTKRKKSQNRSKFIHKKRRVSNKKSRRCPVSSKKIRQKKNYVSAKNIELTDAQCEPNPVWLSQPIENTCIVNTCINNKSETNKSDNDNKLNKDNYCHLTTRLSDNSSDTESPRNISDNNKIISTRKFLEKDYSHLANSTRDPVKKYSKDNQVFTIVGVQNGENNKVIYANLTDDTAAKSKKRNTSTNKAKSLKNNNGEKPRKNIVSEKKSHINSVDIIEQDTSSGVPYLRRTLSYMDEVLPNPMVLYNRMMSYMEVDNTRTNSVIETDADKKKRIIDEVLKEERKMSDSRVVPQNIGKQQNATITPSNINYIPFDLYSKTANKKKIKVQRARELRSPKDITNDNDDKYVKLIGNLQHNEDEVGSIRLTTSYSE